MRYILKYGMADFCGYIDENGQQVHSTLIEYVNNELKVDNIKFTNSIFAEIFSQSFNMLEEFYNSLNQFAIKLDNEQSSAA